MIQDQAIQAAAGDLPWELYAKPGQAFNQKTKAQGIARENAMEWALRSCIPGEAAEAVVARAKVYERYVLGPIRASARARRPEVRVD